MSTDGQGVYVDWATRWRLPDGTFRVMSANSAGGSSEKLAKRRALTVMAGAGTGEAVRRVRTVGAWCPVVEDRTGYTGPTTAGELLALLVDRYSRIGDGTSGATLLIEAAMAMYGEDRDDAVERVGDMITDAMIGRA